MVFNTATVGGAVTPAVISTFITHVRKSPEDPGSHSNVFDSISIASRLPKNQQHIFLTMKDFT